MFSIFTCFSKKHIATWKVRIAKILFSFEEIMKIKICLRKKSFHTKILYSMISLFILILALKNRVKNQFQKIHEQKILYQYWKQNVGWLCLKRNSFQKKKWHGVLVAPIFSLSWKSCWKKNLSHVERHAIAGCIVKKYKQKIF